MAVTETEYVNLAEASRRSGFSRTRIQSLTIAGLVRVEVLPGRMPRYSIEDVVRLAAAEGPRIMLSA